jgi:DNA-binding MarR family transcriptional regulator
MSSADTDELTGSLGVGGAFSGDPTATRAQGVSEPAAQVLRRFRIVFNAVRTHFQQVEKRAGIGGAQVWALSLIAAEPDIGVGRLARAMDIHQTTASNLVKALLQGGFVSAHRSGADRRAVQLRLLPEGRAVLDRVPGPYSGVLPAALDRLDAATLDRLDRDLGALIALLQADERGAAIPLAQM